MGYLGSAGRSSTDQQRNTVLLLGLEETTAAVWSAAARTLGTPCVVVADLAACERHEAGESSVVLVVSAGVFDSGLADRSEPMFDRVVTVVLSDTTEEASFWGWVAWGATARSTPRSEASTILASALKEAAVRCEESELMNDFRRRSATLNENERLAFEAICAGRLNKQIANDFGVSVRTVEQRRRRLFEKMGVDSAVPLAALAAKVQTLEDQNRRHRNRVFAWPARQPDRSLPVARPKFASRPTENPASGSDLMD